jgi:hypothetical protein
VALLALAVLLGRPLGPDEYPREVRRLLHEACDPMRWSLVPPMRTWLTRALALTPKPFTTAAEALESLDELLPRVSGMWAARLLPQNLVNPASGTPAPPLPPAADRNEHARLSSGVVQSRSEPARPAEQVVTHTPSVSSTPPQPVASISAALSALPPELSAADAPVAGPSSAAAVHPSPSRAAEPIAITAVIPSDYRLWLVCLGLAAIALLEAVCLLILLLKR